MPGHNKLFLLFNQSVCQERCMDGFYFKRFPTLEATSCHCEGVSGPMTGAHCQGRGCTISALHLGQQIFNGLYFPTPPLVFIFPPMFPTLLLVFLKCNSCAERMQGHLIRCWSLASGLPQVLLTQPLDTLTPHGSNEEQIDHCINVSHRVTVANYKLSLLQGLCGQPLKQISP